MVEKTYHVLFLSRRNSARSIFAEAMMNSKGRGRFRGYSAAVAPCPKIDPYVIELLQSLHLPTVGLRPKHYEEFAQPGAPDLDFVFTLSDTVRNEATPEWPGHPVTAHWDSPDPILTEGAEWERKRPFRRVYAELERWLDIFMQLPFESLDRLSLKQCLDDIGAPRGIAR